MKSLLLLVCMALSLCLFAQQKEKIVRKIPATRTIQKITIDGDISDEAWKSAPLLTNMVEWRPAFGKVENDASRTEIRILYDNAAIYIAGFCHESTNDSISSELVGRDVVGINDFVGVLFDTYNDKINGFGYYVTPLGEQFDAKYSSVGEDGSWSSVYESKAKIVPGGWMFEMKIPYSAIRFANIPLQDWGINITRRRNKTGQQFMWNPTDPTIGGNFLAQFGLWTGIEGIKTPVRLSFSPYLSTYLTHYPYNDPTVKNTTTAVNGGMDVKYGVSQAFTLDMTLIPDFGQVQSDNHVLNLTPFEVKYNENRSFFTEGIDLFSKGDLFYSRRIGGSPIHYSDAYSNLRTGETITRNPQETRLVNATKLSGRTSSGLGIGFFNAVTNPAYATVEAGGKEVRKIETDPLTNYNIIVLDQSLKRNSSVSLINTNVTRSGTDYDANVTAGLYDFYDKKNDFNISGKFAVSQLIGYNADKSNRTGILNNIGINKTGGRFNMSIWQNLTDNKFNSNDMGYFTNNNYLDQGFWFAYKWLKPKDWYNRIQLNINGTLSTRYKPSDFQSLWLNFNGNTQLKSLWWIGGGFNYNARANDFYEPRVGGRVFKRPAYTYYGMWVESNGAKKYYFNAQLYQTHSGEYQSHGYDIAFNNRFRFNKKLTISTNTSVNTIKNDLGFATLANDTTIIGLRKRTTVENIFTIKYNFNNTMGLSFRARHYWSAVDNKQFFTLANDGGLTNNPTDYTGRANYNVNYFNIDMVYTWQFALGSFLNIVWKNAIGSQDYRINDPYFKNFTNTLNSPQQNSLSVRVIYFLDYLSLKKK